MAKQPQISYPFVEVLTGDEIQHAMARMVLARKGLTPAEVDLALQKHQVQVSYRNVKFPDGSMSLFASVGVFASTTEEATSTPVPQEPKNG